VDSAIHDMVVQSGAGGQPKFQIGPPQYTWEVVVSFVGEREV